MSFAIENEASKGFNKIILKDETTGTSVEIIPSCGAILHAFTVLHNGKAINVIDHYDDEKDFENNVTAKGFKSCKLSPFACRIKDAAYKFGGTSYTIEKFILNGSALHGLLYDAIFTVSEQHSDDREATVTLFHQYKNDDKGYPFYYDCFVTYKLQKENTVTLTTEIINRSNGLIPVQDGWHPYFGFGKKIDALQLEFKTKQKVDMNAALIPTGKLLAYDTFNTLTEIGDTFFDDCFELNAAECQPLCVLRDTEQKIQLAIHPSKTYPYLQIYTPPHRMSIAIENLSAPPDAFNNAIGLITLQPGEATSFETTYIITLL